MKIQGNTVLVTGGCSGIGKIMGRMCLEKGACKLVVWDIIGQTSSGGACINDTIMHIANSKVPFGGVGNSGMGSYHSERSFLAFSHERAVIKSPTWIDLAFRYMPYKLFPLIKKML